MYFFCPKCKTRKDGKKRTHDSCKDCFAKEQAKKQGRAILEEILQKREEAVQRREEDVKVREELVRSREQAAAIWEIKLRQREILQDIEEEKIRNEKKRLREEEEEPSPKRKRFCDLGQRRRQQLAAEAASHLKRLSRGEPWGLLDLVSRKLGWRREERHEINFIANLIEFSKTYLPSLPEPNRIASLLTRGLTLEEAHGVTGVPVSSLSWGRREIENGESFRPEVSPNKSFHNITATAPSLYHRSPQRQFARLLLKNGLRSGNLLSGWRL